jgi:hypothetical protein
MQRLWRWVLWAAVGGSLMAPLQADEGDFTDRLSEADFRRAGLHKLTPGERTALNDLVAGRVRVEAEQAATVAVERERERERVNRERPPRRGPERNAPVVGRLQGEFRGWGPRTVFRLESGEWWQVDDGTSYVTRPVESPTVEITPGALGSYWMRIGERGPRVRVRPMN